MWFMWKGKSEHCRWGQGPLAVEFVGGRLWWLCSNCNWSSSLNVERVDNVTNLPQSKHWTVYGSWPMDIAKFWRDGWRQKDEVDDEEETKELLQDRDLCGKEMTAEDVDSFIWA